MERVKKFDKNESVFKDELLAKIKTIVVNFLKENHNDKILYLYKK
jgi:hypothetical protein